MPIRLHRLPLLLLAVVTLLLAISANAFAQGGLAPAGATVAGVDIAGLDEPAALAKVTAAYNQPIVIRVGTRTFQIVNARIGANADLQTAVATAIASPAGNTPVVTTYSERKLKAVVDKVVRLAGTKPGESRWRLTRTRPLLKVGKAGKAPQRSQIVAQVRHAIADFSLRPQQDVVALHTVKATTDLRSLGYVIVVSKGERILRLYAPVHGRAKVVRTFTVAVGAPSFPTPSGVFRIVDMKKDPWWYPPTSTWAAGAQPIPPGPSNPLGTRWMGLDREDVGIHGTPDSSSLGGYASHGCIRMYIPSAETLYSLVRVGTPVLIY